MIQSSFYIYQQSLTHSLSSDSATLIKNISGQYTLNIKYAYVWSWTNEIDLLINL